MNIIKRVLSWFKKKETVIEDRIVECCNAGAVEHLRRVPAPRNYYQLTKDGQYIAAEDIDPTTHNAERAAVWERVRATEKELMEQTQLTEINPTNAASALYRRWILTNVRNQWRSTSQEDFAYLQMNYKVVRKYGIKLKQINLTYNPGFYIVDFITPDRLPGMHRSCWSARRYHALYEKIGKNEYLRLSLIEIILTSNSLISIPDKIWSFCNMIHGRTLYEFAIYLSEKTNDYTMLDSLDIFGTAGDTITNHALAREFVRHAKRMCTRHAPLGLFEHYIDFAIVKMTAERNNETKTNNDPKSIQHKSVDENNQEGIDNDGTEATGDQA